MTHQFIDGTFRQTNLDNETAQYLHKREELRLAEIDLMRQRELVAALRRALPQGAALPEYSFMEGPDDLRLGDSPVRNVKLSQLFTQQSRPLIIYHFMFGKKQT